MIVDTLDMLSRYTALNPLFADVVEYLENNDPYGIMTMSALWGADSLTHQNRFSGVSKVYGIDV